MARVMPAIGYYVSTGPYPEVIFSTGTKKQNKYWRPSHKTTPWVYLLWTCLPGAKDILAFDYYPTYADFEAAYKAGKHPHNLPECV